MLLISSIISSSRQPVSPVILSPPNLAITSSYLVASNTNFPSPTKSFRLPVVLSSRLPVSPSPPHPTFGAKATMVI
ncbi:hypothetical protein E2C01_061159 [Portunus trituberculatus]|uniref:Uncharacterized protein n=1 Tax=Portunus trituberculatus TaxID=210409 RepID=A0A5B7HAX7_PORTR|nr:hypothetical protein [Portunus trituberculatus]